MMLKWDHCLLRTKILNIYYAQVKPLKDKKAKTVLNAFTEIGNESYHKPNKLSVNQGTDLQ